MSDLDQRGRSRSLAVWKSVAVAGIASFVFTSIATVLLADKLKAARSALRVQEIMRDGDRKISEQQRATSNRFHQMQIERERESRDFYRWRLYGHSYERFPEVGSLVDLVKAGESSAKAYRSSEFPEMACSGLMAVGPAFERGQFRQWIFNIDQERVKFVRFRYSVEPHDSQGFLLSRQSTVLTAEILPVLTTSDEVEFFLWVSSSWRPYDPFHRRLVPLGRVPRATAETESFVLVTKLEESKALRPWETLPLFDVVRQSDGEVVVSLVGYVEGLRRPVEAPRPDA